MIGIHKNDANLSIQKLKTNILDIFKMYTKKAMKKIMSFMKRNYFLIMIARGEEFILIV